MGNDVSTEAWVADDVPTATLRERSLSAFATHILNAPPDSVIFMVGAGISTSAGIPDFRSPKTGLYHNLQRFNLPEPEDVFNISFFRHNPAPFYLLAQELYPGNFFPTVTHAFIRLLHEKGKLQMVFTQNIDCLERAAGIPAHKIVECHGSFATQHCIECHATYPDEPMREHVKAGTIPRCQQEGCDGLVKPDITFFGEGLPDRFFQQCSRVSTCTTAIVMGTSLTVAPFSLLPPMVPGGPSDNDDAPGWVTPRLLINRERVGDFRKRTDDVLELGPCDRGVRRLAAELGWLDDLETLWRGMVGEEEAGRQLTRLAELELVEEYGSDGDNNSSDVGDAHEEDVEIQRLEEDAAAMHVSDSQGKEEHRVGVAHRPIAGLDHVFVGIKERQVEAARCSVDDGGGQPSLAPKNNTAPVAQAPLPLLPAYPNTATGAATIMVGGMPIIMASSETNTAPLPQLGQEGHDQV